MAGTVNRVILIGHLGKDPEVFGEGDRRTVKFSIATSESWRDKATGERKEVTDWHNIVVFDKAAGEFAEKFLKKGNKVYVEGKQKTRKWTDQGGVDRWTTDVVIAAFGGRLDNLTKREGAGSGGTPSEDDYGTPSRPRDTGANDGSPEDEIPF